MELKIDRFFKGSDYTIGRLYIDGEYFSDTLEDPDRGLIKGITPIDDIQEVKAKHLGDTAIPRGKYLCTVTWSPKFKRYLVLVNNVPCWSGIRLHNGSNKSHSQGCIILGFNTIKGMVTDSKKTLEQFMKVIMEKADEEQIWLTIS